MISKRGETGWPAWLLKAGAEFKTEAGRAWLDRVAGRILDKARLGGGDVVLDLGAGLGLLTVRAARQTAPEGRVVALDASRECLERLERECAELGIDNVSARVGRIERLPFASGTFDAAVSRSALCYTRDLFASAGEIERVLTPGGRFSLFEPLLGEIWWNGDAGRAGEGIARMDSILREKRAPSRVDRGLLRGAFARARLAQHESLVVHFTLKGEGMSEEELVGEYMEDMPGELAASRVLKDAGVSDEEIRGVACAVARLMATGRLQRILPCMFLWGVKRGV